ncbi:transmembrane 4 L6 family member 5 [Antennarius striatus]|uniref:transmembrane 4 L6 family member 5 n=1 Tax=Antennarius striatus TaxID=241820 RepID=UPI0035B34FF7
MLPFMAVGVSLCRLKVWFLWWVFSQQRVKMCVLRCVRCVGVLLVPTAIVCMLSNILLLLPDLDPHFLLEGHVTREATWATGLWASGLLVLVKSRHFLRGSETKGCWEFRSQMLAQLPPSLVCLLAAGLCLLVSATALVQGPLCLHETPSGLAWGVPLQPLPDRHAGYLYNQTLWTGVCLQPRGVVQWNLVLFSVMGAASGLQALLCGANVCNLLLGLVLGPRPSHNKVGPVSV